MASFSSTNHLNSEKVPRLPDIWRLLCLKTPADVRTSALRTETVDVSVLRSAGDLVVVKMSPELATDQVFVARTC